MNNGHVRFDKQNRMQQWVLTSCSIKSGKVVVMLNGRFAGRKAIVVKTYDEGHSSRKFGHAIGKCSE